MTRQHTHHEVAPLATDRLNELVRAKHDVLVPLHELARKQVAAIAADDVDQLLSLLAAKQPLLRQLEQVERELDPFRQENPDQRTWRTPVERRACQQVAEKANLLLAELLAMEQQCDARLKASRDATAHQLQSAGRALAARQAYAPQAASAQSSNFDLSSEG